MNLYMVRFDGGHRHVEAASFGEAQRLWLAAMKEPWGKDWRGDEEPDEIVRVDELPAIRAVRVEAAAKAPAPRKEQVVPTYSRRVQVSSPPTVDALVAFLKRHDAEGHATPPSRPDIAEALGLSRESRRSLMALLDKARDAKRVAWDLDGQGKMIPGSIRVASPVAEKKAPSKAAGRPVKGGSKCTIEDLCLFIDRYREVTGFGPNRTDIRNTFGYERSGGGCVTALLNRARAAGMVTWDVGSNGRQVFRSVRTVKPGPAANPGRPVAVYGHTDIPPKLDPESLRLPFTNGAPR